MKITRFGHACVLIEVSGIRILIDPGSFSADDAFALDDLDGIVVTHQHPDHLDVERAPALLERNSAAICLADPETAGLLTFGNWIPNADSVATALGSVTITGVGSHHAVILDALPRVANVGVLIAASDSPTFFHPGDSYEYVPHGVDVLALPLSAPWAKISETVNFVQKVSPRVVLPIHDRTISELAYGIYWGQVARFCGVDDTRQLGQTDSTEVE